MTGIAVQEIQTVAVGNLMEGIAGLGRPGDVGPYRRPAPQLK
jgi:hypothetical protein